MSIEKRKEGDAFAYSNLSMSSVDYIQMQSEQQSLLTIIPDKSFSMEGKPFDKVKEYSK